MIKRLLMFLILPFLGLTLLPPPQIQGEGQISKPGRYAGYTQPIYYQWVRVSQFITVRDGVKLAADIFRPSVNGNPVSEPLPVIWAHQRYYRDLGLPGIEFPASWLETVLEHGYIIASVDVRGSGASFGTRTGEYTRVEALDAYDVTEWFADRPWCNGRIGMYGRSYMGVDQYMAASTAPPHLKAIFPEMAGFDLYTFIYPGGVLRDNFLSHWGSMTRNLDQVQLARPIDEDSDGLLLKQARKEHMANMDLYKTISKLGFRDSKYVSTGTTPFMDWNPASYLKEINQSGVAVYQLAGWYDVYPRDALLWFKNLTNSQKLVIGPWSHREEDGFDLAAEHLRWYDYWLKGVANGVMGEAPILYYTMGAPEGTQWRSAWQWPLPNQRPTKFFLQIGKSGSVQSVNDGCLELEPPFQTTGDDDYTVNYQTTSGISTRWVSGYSGRFYYPDMTPNDRKGLTYTTPPLTAGLEVTGSPVVNLWISSTTKDVDFFAYLEEVDEMGFSKYITEGMLRGSHRTMDTPPYDNLGLPYHSSLSRGSINLPKGEPVELLFDLLPTSYLFKAGRRIRLTITCTDRDNNQALKQWPPPRVSVYRNASYASNIVLPVIPPQ